VEISTPIRRMTYADAMARYGSDKPDLRFGMEFVDFADIARESNFSVFKAAAESGGWVKGINAKGLGSYSRKQLDDLTEFAKGYKAKGLAYIIIAEDGELRSPWTKFLTEAQLAEVVRRLDGKPGDLLLFVADKPDVVAAALGAVRLELGNRLGLRDPKRFELLWVVDFPLLEWD
ncbi:MAG: GAD domain-containing protein, partial [Allosphingosinicella sp.]